MKVLLEFFFLSNWFKLAGQEQHINTRSTPLPCGWRPEENDVWRFSLPRGFLTVKLQASVWTNTQIQWNSEMRTPVGQRKKSRLCWVLAAYCRAQEKEVSLPDFIRISVKLLRVQLNVLVTVQRPPSHPSFLTTNSSRYFSRSARLGFIFPTPSASSHPSFWLPPT